MPLQTAKVWENYLMKIREQFVTDKHGSKIGVFLSIEDYMMLRMMAEKSEHISSAEDINENESATEEIKLDDIRKEIKE